MSPVHKAIVVAALAAIACVYVMWSMDTDARPISRGKRALQAGAYALGFALFTWVAARQFASYQGAAAPPDVLVSKRITLVAGYLYSVAVVARIAWTTALGRPVLGARWKRSSRR